MEYIVHQDGPDFYLENEQGHVATVSFQVPVTDGDHAQAEKARQEFMTLADASGWQIVWGS